MLEQPLVSSAAASNEERPSNAPESTPEETEHADPELAIEKQNAAGVALEFDMSTGPLRQPPKELANRLSEKRSSKRRSSQESSGCDIIDETVDHNSGSASSQSTEKVKRGDKSKKDKSKTKRVFDCGSLSKVAAPASTDLPPLTSAAKASTTLAPLRAPPVMKREMPKQLTLDAELVPDFQCIGCDHQIMCVREQRWAGEVPYMELRNYYPDASKLGSLLVPQPGSSAYFCQCSSKTAGSMDDLSDVAEGLRWKLVKAA
jgi:hypothetical protein